MPRLSALASDQVSSETKQLLEVAQSHHGFASNLMRTLANSPVVLAAYVNFNHALAGGTLSAAEREQIALAVAEANLCSYCLSVHTVRGKQCGLPTEAVASARRACADDPKTDAMLKLAVAVIVKRGEISEGDFANAKLAGLTAGEVSEVVANVILVIFTNYFVHVALPDLDFPKVEPGADYSTRGQSDG